MILYRITKAKYVTDISGRGATAGTRWNSPGNTVLFTAQTLQLALFEIMVHISHDNLDNRFKLITLEIPDNLKIKKINEDLLPKNWLESNDSSLTRKIGDSWLNEKDTVGLQVPSALINGSHNYLFNPKHPDFIQIRLLSVEDISFDGRLNFEARIIETSLLKDELSSSNFAKKIGKLQTYKEKFDSRKNFHDKSLKLHFDRETYKEAFTWADNIVDLKPVN